MARRSVVEILIQARDATSGAFRTATNGVNSFARRLLSIQGLIAGIFSAAAFRITKAILSAFAEQEQAVVKLNAALAATGRFSEEGTKKLQEMASQLQQMTVFGDEAILGATNVLAQLSDNLSTDELAEAQKAVVSLASTFQLDLNGAAQLLGKTLSGQINMLSRYGIQIDTTKDAHGRLAEILEKTASFFEVARAQAQTFGGAIVQMRNAFGDLLEVVGQVLVGVFRLDENSRGAKEVFEGWTAALTENIGSWIKWGRVSVAAIVAVGKSLGFIIKLAFNVGQFIGHAFETGITTIAALIVDFVDSQIIGSFNRVLDAVDILKNAITGTGLAFRIPTIGSERLWQSASEGAILVHKQVADINNGLIDLGESWVRVAAAVNSQPITPKIAAPPNQTRADAGADPSARAKELTEQVATLRQQFTDGALAGDAFRAAMVPLVAQMVALRDSGALTGKELAAFTKSVGEAQTAVGNVTVTEFERLAESADEVMTRFQSGALTFDAYQTELAPIARSLMELRDSTELTAAQQQVLAAAFDKVRDAAAGLALNAPAIEVERLGREYDLLVAKFDAGLISFDDFSAGLAKIAPALLAIRDGGELGTVAMTNLINRIEAIRAKAIEAAQGVQGEGSIAAPSFWEKVARSMDGATDAGLAFAEVVGDAVTATAEGFGTAIESAFEAVVTGSEDAGTAFKNAMLGAISSVASGLGRLYIGEAAAEVAKALANPAGAGAHLAAAAKFTAAAALMFALAGSLRGAASGGGGGGGGGGPAGAGQDARDRERERGEVTFVLPNGFINTADSAQVDALADAIETVSGRRVTIRQGL